MIVVHESLIVQMKVLKHALTCAVLYLCPNLLFGLNGISATPSLFVNARGGHRSLVLTHDFPFPTVLIEASAAVIFIQFTIGKIDPAAFREVKPVKRVSVANIR